jgi:cellulose biosynthesis protein BcsQ
MEQDDPWKVHFILNSKGGVGKSFIAFLLAQYCRQRGKRPVVCFDADATTSTFSSFAVLDVTRTELMQGPVSTSAASISSWRKSSPMTPMR